MSSTIRNYFSELNSQIGEAWNRFWFTPADVSLVAFLRIVIGLSGLLFVISHTADLTVWFDHLLPIETVQQMTGASNQIDGDPVFHLSYFYFTDNPAEIWMLHFLGIVTLVALTVGIATRISCVLSLIVVLSYIHRAPMITGQLEPVLSMLLLYLCVAPSGSRFSLDSWLRRRRQLEFVQDRSVAANFSLRLMQIHLAMFYLTMGMTKLAGDTWWVGEAVWWLSARPESRLVDLTSLYNWMMFINLWTHAIVAFELTFAILVWNRLARPLLLALAAIMWSSLALLTGLIGFCALMLAASFCYVSPDFFRKLTAS